MRLIETCFKHRTRYKLWQGGPITIWIRCCSGGQNANGYVKLPPLTVLPNLADRIAASTQSPRDGSGVSATDALVTTPSGDTVIAIFTVPLMPLFSPHDTTRGFTWSMPAR